MRRVSNRVRSCMQRDKLCASSAQHKNKWNINFDLHLPKNLSCTINKNFFTLNFFSYYLVDAFYIHFYASLIFFSFIFITICTVHTPSSFLSSFFFTFFLLIFPFFAYYFSHHHHRHHHHPNKIFLEFKIFFRVMFCEFFSRSLH